MQLDIPARSAASSTLMAPAKLFCRKLIAVVRCASGRISESVLRRGTIAAGETYTGVFGISSPFSMRFIRSHIFRPRSRPAPLMRLVGIGALSAIAGLSVLHSTAISSGTRSSSSPSTR